MAIKTKEELLSSIKTVLGDNTDDNSLAIIEDISDTYDDMNNKAKGDGKDWKAEAEKIDREWRQKYHDRFFNPNNDEDVDPLKPESIEPKKYRFEDLFTNK